MSSAFTITVSATNVRLDTSNRRSEVTYTVFNATGRVIRASPHIKTENPAAQAWLTVDGEAEREFFVECVQPTNVGIDQYLCAPWLVRRMR